MIAILISDISAWVKRGSRLSYSLIIMLLTIAAGVTYFRPEAVTEAFTLVIVWMALYTGEERWGNPEVWQWVSRGEITPLRVMIGKAISLAFLLLLMAMTTAPILVMTEMIWGIPVNRIWMVFPVWLVTAETSMAIGATAHYFRDQNPYFGSLLLLAWLGSTAIVPGLHPVNPFVRVWQVMSSANPNDHGIYLFVNLFLVVGMLTTVGWRLRKEVNWRLGQEIHH